MAGGFQKMVPYKIKSMLARRMRLIVQNVTYQRESSRTKCEDCGEKIPVARQKTLKGIRLCVSCQEEVDREEIISLSINRRANKDN